MFNLTMFCPSGEFWLGLENIHSLSKQGQYILQVELADWAGQQLPVARYRFQLDGEEKKFTLHLEDESSSGVQEKIMSTGASGLPFSTADRDNDLAADVNCAELLSGTTSLAPKPQHMQTKLSGWVHTSKTILGSSGLSFHKNALLLQVVGGSAIVASRTSMADIPEGRAHSGDKDEGCFGRPQRDKTTL